MQIYNLNELKCIFPNLNFDWICDIEHVLSKLNGLNWYFVGGCVRDSLINKTTYDIDITTTAMPSEIEERMQSFTMATIGREFGTIGVYINKWKIEITTTRNDTKTFGRFAEVNFISSFYEDSCRRDFTINSLLFNGKELIDYHNGITDLINHKILFIGDSTSTTEDQIPNILQKNNDLNEKYNNIQIHNENIIKDAYKRINEDFLRIIRYIRFYFRFNKDNKNLMYMNVFKECLHGLKHVSKERFLAEIESICKNENRILALQTLNELNLSKTMFNIDLNLNELLNFYNMFMDHDISFVYTILFKNANKEILNTLPLSREVKRMISWFHKPKYSCDILQAAHIYNSSNNLNHFYFFLIIKKITLYNNIVNKSLNFIKINLLSYKDIMRSYMNDLCIGVQLLKYDK